MLHIKVISYKVICTQLKINTHFGGSSDLMQIADALGGDGPEKSSSSISFVDTLGNAYLKVGLFSSRDVSVFVTKYPQSLLHVKCWL